MCDIEELLDIEDAKLSLYINRSFVSSENAEREMRKRSST